MSPQNTVTFLRVIFGVFMVGLSALPIIAVIWLFAWIKDTREIIAVLKKHFPEDFEDEGR